MSNKYLKKTKKYIILSISLVLISFLIWYGFFRTVEIVKSEEVVKGDIKNVVSALGVLQPHNYVDIGAQVSGQIEKIHVKAGDIVKKGDLLVEIDPSIQSATVQTDRASLENLNAHLIEQKAAFELASFQAIRQEQLLKSNATKLEDVQIAQANLKMAHAKIKSLEAQIKGAKSTLQGNEALLGYTKIYAPMDGTVVSLSAKEGQTLNATYQTPKLLRVADLSKMTVWTEVSEADIGKLKIGMDIYFTTLGLKDEKGELRTWKGKLQQILPAPVQSGQDDEQKEATSTKVVLYTALFDIENSDNSLMSQMSAQVFFVESFANDVLLVPLYTLKEQKDGTYLAKVLANDKVEERVLTIGIKDRLYGEVLDGLKENELIVTKIEKQKASSRLQW
ncbi:efflux RND transporter periplasmic adaptor subunit [Arcobacter lanthieri]|uniref:efflux RND transporter periplasmic adaptor subunit n=1 Tax=Aliarcobacter lanthieri TaxID=1355374 RepID=UPI001923767D|nr:efflux RND transporter periplasmic adaptor subunit [Aliarcobacter lanthieri]MBL3519404.1 efflux RND transporter periplasmic adaptor subunit [Aliarcobacter lanthieri]